MCEFTPSNESMVEYRPASRNDNLLAVAILIIRDATADRTIGRAFTVHDWLACRSWEATNASGSRACRYERSADALLLGALINVPVSTRPRSPARLADRIIISPLSSLSLSAFFFVASCPVMGAFEKTERRPAPWPWREAEEFRLSIDLSSSWETHVVANACKWFCGVRALGQRAWKVAVLFISHYFWLIYLSRNTRYLMRVI